MTLTSLGHLELDVGDLPAARLYYGEAVEIASRGFGSRNPMLAYPIGGLGRVLLAQGDARGAEPLLRRAYDLRAGQFSEDDPLVLEARRDLDRCLLALGKTSPSATRVTGFIEN